MAIGTAPFDVGQRASQVDTVSAIRPYPVAENTIDDGFERLVRTMDTGTGNAFKVASGGEQDNNLPS